MVIQVQPQFFLGVARIRCCNVILSVGGNFTCSTACSKTTCDSKFRLQSNSTYITQISAASSGVPYSRGFHVSGKLKKNYSYSTQFGNQPAPYRGLSGPPGPKCQKSLENVSGTVREVSGESRESVWRVFLEYSGTFWRLFGGPGAGGPGRHFRDFFGISGPEGPRDLCKGRAGSQYTIVVKFITMRLQHGCITQLLLN